MLLCLYPRLRLKIQLPGERLLLPLKIAVLTFQLLAALRLLLQLLLRLKLCLCDLLDEYLPDLHIRNIPVLDDLFFDLPDELRPHRLILLLRQLRHLARI